MFQGRDWASYRWTVAEAFDTLDRLHDLGLCQGWTDEPDLADDSFCFIPDLMGLCEELACQMKLVYADVLCDGDAAPTLQQKWAMMEAEALVNELSEKIQTLWSNETTQDFSALVILTSSLKALLKRLDQ